MATPTTNSQPAKPAADQAGQNRWLSRLTAVRRPSAAFALLLLLAAGGCYYDNEEELYELYYASSPCDTSQVTFSQTVFPIIQGNCAVSGCHVAGGSGPGLMENYNQIKSFVDNGRLEARALVQRDMPPSGPLTDCQQNQLRAWISAGAPDN